MKDLDLLSLECFRICNDLEIPFADEIEIKWNGRISRKWGYCRKTGNHYDISIARRLDDDAIPDEKVMSVILHEILHTCPGCMNHGKLWKSYGKLIKHIYHIKIKTTSSAEDLNVENKYIIKCRNCGCKTRYAMKPRNTERYCLVCGSKKLTCFEKTIDEFGEKGKIKLWKRK